MRRKTPSVADARPADAGGHAAPRRRNRPATEAALIAAASEVFAERGYEAATTRAIAERAGCSEALIQAYFHGKESLLLTVLQHEGGGQAEQAVFFARPLCATLEAEARETLSHCLSVLGRRSGVLRIVLSRVLVDPQFKDEFNRVAIRTSIRQDLGSRLARYADRLGPGFDPMVAAEMLISLSFELGFIHREVLRSDTIEVDRLAAAFAAAFGCAFGSLTARGA